MQPNSIRTSITTVRPIIDTVGTDNEAVRATAVIESYLNRSLQRQTLTASYRPDYNAREVTLHLPVYPVESITSVTHNRIAVQSSNYYQQGEDLVVLTNLNACAGDSIEITYVGGYGIPTGVPYDLREACSRVIDSLAGLGDANRISGSIGGVSYTTDAPTSPIPFAVRMLLAPYKRYSA